MTQSSAPEPQPAHALGDRGLAGADDHAQPGQPRAELVEVRPALRTQHRQIDHDRVQPQRDHRIQRHRRGEHAVLPAHALQPLAQHLQEAGVGIDHRQADRRLPRGAGAPLVNHHRRHLAAETTHERALVRPAKPSGNHMFTGRKPDCRNDAQETCEASENSRNSPVTTNATCSPMSTALSPIRSMRARDEHHRHRPLAPVGVGADLDRAREHAAIQAVDLLVLAHEILGDGDVAQQERLLGLLDLASARAGPCGRCTRASASSFGGS